MKVFDNINNLKVKQCDGDIKKGCLVLEGGDFRGIYTAGVLDYFMENNLNLDVCYGVSAGALTATNYFAGSFGRSALLILENRFNKRYVGLPALKESGSVVGFNFMFDDLNKIYPLDEKRVFCANRTLYITTTNIETGEAEYFTNHDDKDTFYRAIRAGASIPLVSKTVEINGKYYLDGGIATKIPIRKALLDNNEKIIFVGTRESTYRRKEETGEYELAKAVYHDYPLFLEAFKKANENYNKDCDLIDSLVLQKKIYRITPSRPVAISRLEKNIDKLANLYYCGYFDAMANFDDLLAYLKS